MNAHVHWPADAAVFDLVSAWDVVNLADAARRAEPEARLREALDAIDMLGDFGGAIPKEVLRAARHMARRWLLSAPEIRAGRLGAACDAVMGCAQSYLAGTIEEPVTRSFYQRMRAGDA